MYGMKDLFFPVLVQQRTWKEKNLVHFLIFSGFSRKKFPGFFKETGDTWQNLSYSHSLAGCCQE